MCMYDKQESIPVGCVPLTSVATTRCQYQWGEVGPQVHKFEQVSSDDHQMSVAGVGMAKGRGWVCPEGGGVGVEVGMSREGYPLPCDLSHDAYDVTYPLTRTDTQL